MKLGSKPCSNMWFKHVMKFIFLLCNQYIFIQCFDLDTFELSTIHGNFHANLYIYSYIVSKQDDASPSMETRNMCYQSPFGHYVPWLCLRRNALTSLPLQLRRWLTWPTGFTQVPAQFFPVLQRRIPKSQTLVWFKTVFLSISFEYVSHAILPGYHEWKIIPCFFPYIGSCVITIIFMDYRDCTTIFSLLITTFT